jgi:hypothetical protein
MNAASDEENPAQLDEESPAQLELPLNPPTSHEPLGTAKWIARTTTVPATTAPATTARDVPIGQKRILFVWLCLATLSYSGYFIFSLFYALVNVLFSNYGKGLSMESALAACIALVISVLIAWAVISMWKAYGEREYRLVMCFSIVPAFSFLFFFISIFTHE